MEISKSSWHFWLVKNIAKINHPSRSLCGYFWQVIWSLFLSALLVMIAVGMVFSPFALLGWIAVPGTTSVITALWTFTLAVGTVAWMLVGAILLAFVIMGTIFYTKKLFNKYRPEPKESKPSLVGSYVRAKKSKICPMLDFKDK